MLLALASPSHPSPSSSSFHPHPHPHHHPHQHSHHHHNHHHQQQQEQQPQLPLQQQMSSKSNSHSTVTAAFSSYITNHHPHLTPITRPLPLHQQPAVFRDQLCHARRRPKLSLQINAVAHSSHRVLRSGQYSAMSPTSRNTLANATILFTPDPPSGASSSSSSEDEDDCDDDDDDDILGSNAPTSSSLQLPPFKDKKRRRRYEATRPKHLSTPMTTTHHPTTTAASFLPRPQPSRRAKSPGERRVRFVNAPPEVFYRDVDDDCESGGKEVVTSMERAIELGRLKEWVRQREALASPGGSSNIGDDGNEWVRKLVQMEMEDLEEEERRLEQQQQEVEIGLRCN